MSSIGGKPTNLVDDELPVLRACLKRDRTPSNILLNEFGYFELNQGQVPVLFFGSSSVDMKAEGEAMSWTCGSDYFGVDGSE